MEHILLEKQQMESNVIAQEHGEPKIDVANILKR